MSLKAVLDKLDDAPEAVRGFYAEKDGKFILNVEPVGGYSLEDVGGLKKALEAERGSRKQLEADVVKYKDIDPDRARAALAELEELKKLDPTKEADKIANTKFEAAKAQLVEAHSKELAPLKERNSKLEATVDKLVRQAQATAALASAKGSVELLLPHVLQHTKVIETETGEFAVRVVDANGNERIGDNQGGAMTLDQLVAEMRSSDTFARAFDGSGHSGTGKQVDVPGGKSKADVGGTREERRAYFAQKLGQSS